METRPRGNGDDSGGWGLTTTLKTKELGSGYDSGDFVAGDWRQKWSFSAWDVETTLETQWLGFPFQAAKSLKLSPLPPC